MIKNIRSTLSVMPIASTKLNFTYDIIFVLVFALMFCCWGYSKYALNESPKCRPFVVITLNKIFAMKNILLLVIILSSCISNNYSQNRQRSKNAGEINTKYISEDAYGNILTKIDASGNALWARNSEGTISLLLSF